MSVDVKTVFLCNLGLIVTISTRGYHPIHSSTKRGLLSVILTHDSYPLGCKYFTLKTVIIHI